MNMTRNGLGKAPQTLKVEDSIDQGITTPSPMLSALPDSPSPPGFNESSAMSQSMWSDEIEYVDLEKEDRGLGFSILDYKDPESPEKTVIVIRGLVPGGVAEHDGRLHPGDRLMSVNDTDLEHSSLSFAVQTLKWTPKGKVRIGVARPSPDEYDEEGISTGESPPDTARYKGKPQFESTVQGKQRERKHSALIGDIEVEKVSDNESSDSEDEDRSAKFDFGPPLLFSGDSMDLDSLPDNIKSRMETITIRRQMVGKLGVRLEGDEDGCGCEVTSVLAGMAVGLDGRIKVGDRIVAVNDASMIGLSGPRARPVLRNQASDSSRKDIVFTFIPSDIQQSPSSFLEDTSTSSMEAEPEQRRDELEEHKIPPQGVGDPPDLLQPVRPPIYEEPGVRVVELTREPNSALGIIIEGGKVGTEDLGLRGIFIRHIDMSSPAARVGTLLTGDQILEVNGHDLRDASHDKAVEIIKHAKNPVRFVIRTVASSTGLPPKTPVTPEVTHDNQVEPSSVTVTSARPSAELVTLPPNKSLRKDIPIPAKHLSTKAGEPITSVVKSGEVKAEIESKRLILPPRLTMVKSEEDRKRLSIAGGKGTAANRSFDVYVKPGGPAEKNGKIQQADEILEVNDGTIRGLTHYEVSAILKNTPPEVELVLGRSQEAADFLRTPPADETPRGGQFPEPKAKALNVGSIESSPTAQRRQTESSGPSGPSPTSSPPPVTGVITVSPTLLKELSGGRQLEFVDFIKSPTGLGFAVVERPGFVEGQTGIYVKDITEGGPAQKDNRLRKGDQLIVVDNQPFVGLTHAEAVAILKRTKGKVSLVVARKQTQPGSASAPEKATASVPPRRETGNPRTPKRGPPDAKKPVRDSLSDPKLHGSPRKPASPEETKKPIESMPTGSLILPRKQPVKPEPLEPEVQLIQHSPKETPGLSIAGGKGAAANRSFVADVKPGGPVEKNEKIQQADEIVEVNDVTIRGFTHYEASAIRKSPAGLGFAVVERPRFDEGQKITYLKDITEGGPAQKDNCLRKGDQLIAVDNQPIVRLTHAQAARKQTQPGSALAPEKATASIFPKRETGPPAVPKTGPPVAKKPVRKQTQPGSAQAPEKATVSVSPRRETGPPGVPKRGPPVAKKPVRKQTQPGSALAPEKATASVSPRRETGRPGVPKRGPSVPKKPASLEGGKEAYERMPTGKPVVPRIQLVKPEAAEREFQGVQQSPRETADLSDTSSITSDTSSLTSDESWTGGRKPVYKLKLSHISGQVVVGPKSKLIYTHPKDGDNRDVTHADKSDSPGSSSGASPSKECSNYVQSDKSNSPVTSTGAHLSKEGSENDKFQDKNATLVSEPILGSYCLSNYSRLEDIEKEEECNLKPCRGIIICKGDEEDQWSLRSFFKDPDRFIQEMDKSANLCKERMEDFILHEIFPHLEKSWGKCPSSNEDVYKIIAKISRSINSGTIVRHALQLLFHLICKDDFGSANDNLLVVEGVIRTSIFSSEGMFAKDEHSEGNLKLFLYSRILSLLLMQKVRQNELPIVDRETVLKNVQGEMRKRCDQLKNKKKDLFRYSMEFILHTITRLLQSHDKLVAPIKLNGLMKECEEYCGSWEMESKDLNILRTLEKKKGLEEWIDLHCILVYLHGKVHSERPAPQMETERRAMKLIRLIVEAYLKGEGGGDWRFCLLASSILVDVAKNNLTEEMRKEAGGCLLNLLKDAKVQKTPECRPLLEQRSSELLFCPDRETRTFLVHFLSRNQNSEDRLPSSLLIEHLSSMYRTQTLEINKTTFHQSQGCFIKRGMFQRRKVAVKVLYVMKDHLLEDDPEFLARWRLIREVDNLKRLTNSQHPHPSFPVLLGFDTKCFPYHLITGFEKEGNLLQLIRVFRKRETHLKPIGLLKMLIDITNALLRLEELGLVHRSVMAENVLVGENYTCKLSGLHSLRKLTYGPNYQDADLALLDGYCSAEVPGYVSTSDDDNNLPVRWKAPECLTENRYSTTSDVWAFGVLIYEVLTHGCIPYRHVFRDDKVPAHIVDRREIVPLEACFEHTEYKLMKQCCEWQPHHRPKLSEVRMKLTQIIQHTEENKPRSDPPPLDMQQANYGNSEFQDGEELHSSIPVTVQQTLSDLQQMQCVAGVVSQASLLVNLEKIASEKGFIISDNEGSGNCMFYALSEQLNLVKGIQISHAGLRQCIVQYLKKNPTMPDGTELVNFVDGHSSWADYLRNMEKDGTWGDHVILHATAHCFKTCIRVISSLLGHHDLTICQHHDVESSSNSSLLVLGHVHEHHYVSLRPKPEERKSKLCPPTQEMQQTPYENDELQDEEEELYSSIPDIPEKSKESIDQDQEERKSKLCSPTREMQQTPYESYELQDEEEELYSSIPDIPEKSKESIDQDQDLYEEVREDLIKKEDQSLTMIWERLLQEDDQHVNRLLTLNHPNLVRIWIETDKHYWITAPECPNLKDFVLDRRCKQGGIVMFLSQVASALHYLHVNHVVHGDLRAEYVNVVAPDKVQVGRLGRSKSLTMSAYDVNSTSCVFQAAMPPDSTRWSAPEVILDGRYTHASDVWAFGILAWELYTSYSTGQEWRQRSVPYHDLYNHEILPYMREKRPLDRPEGCPDWVYIIMHQCWAYNSTQRPPFLAIVDCLTSREPMKSWIMQLWLKNHHESEWPDLSICQPDDAGHVLDAAEHPSWENIERICSEDFFAKHHYNYLFENSATCSSRPCSEENTAFTSSPYNKEPSSKPGNEGLPLVPTYEEIQPKESDEPKKQSCSENETHSSCNTSVDVVGSKKFLNEILQMENSSKTGATYATLSRIPSPSAHPHTDYDCLDRDRYPKDSKLAGRNFIPQNCTLKPECQNKVSKPSHDDCTIHHKTATSIPEDGGKCGISQNLACKTVQEECTIYDKPRAVIPEDKKNRKYENRSAALIALNKVFPEGRNEQTTPSRRKGPDTHPNKEIKLQPEDKENLYENIPPVPQGFQ